jgi:hypothetical protein
MNPDVAPAVLELVELWDAIGPLGYAAIPPTADRLTRHRAPEPASIERFVWQGNVREADGRRVRIFRRVA